MSGITITVDDSMAGYVAMSSRLEKLAQNNAPDLYRVLGVKAQQLIVAGFQNSENPYGQKWKPLKYRTGQPLVDTGTLRASFGVSSAGGYADVGSRVNYAAYHQDGTAKVPARKMIPDAGTPNKWANQMYAAISNWLLQ